MYWPSNRAVAALDGPNMIAFTFGCYESAIVDNNLIEGEVSTLSPTLCYLLSQHTAPASEQQAGRIL